MKKFLAFAALTLASTSLFGQTAYSPPVGGFTTTAAANTDTLVSPTLARDSVWRGVIASGTGNGAGATITATSPGWTASAFAPSAETYYVRVLTGALSGQFFVITGNTTTTLTVDAAGLNLSTLTATDTAEIAPFWTLGTLYPASKAGTAFIASTSSFSRQTELLFFDASSTGINRAASSTYYFLNGAWRKVGQASTTSYDNTVIFPDTYFVHRNKAAATSLVYVGRVQPGAAGTVIEGASTQNDNFVAISFPVDVTLAQSGLVEAGFAASTSSFNRTDQLLVYSTSETGVNRAAAATYYYLNGAWRKVGQSSSTDFGSDKLTAGTGFIIRKAANGSTFKWSLATGF